VIRGQADAPAGFHAVAGFWSLGDFAVRVDIADRVAQQLHAQRLALRSADAAIAPQQTLMTSLGMAPAEFQRLMQALGFRSAAGGGFVYGHRRGRPRQTGARPAMVARPFAGLERMLANDRDPKAGN
jgi:ATP-dependent RNA helicase SUPV3L1/SUV3